MNVKRHSFHHINMICVCFVPAPQNPVKPPASSDAAAASAKAATPFSKKFVNELEEFIGRISGPQSMY